MAESERRGKRRGQFNDRRGSHLLDGGAPFYGVCAAADGKHVAVGALEPAFFAQLCERIGVAPVLALAETPAHPHHTVRGSYVDIDGIRLPAPAPRFSRTPSAIQGPAPAQASLASAVIERWSG